MGYLLYVSHDAENLQFYLWLQDYTNRFFAASSNEQALSPPWSENIHFQQAAPCVVPGPRVSDKTAVDYSINFDRKDIPMSNMEDSKESLMSGSMSGKTMNAVEYAHQQTGLKWQACKSGPATSPELAAYSQEQSPFSPSAPRSIVRSPIT